MNYRPTSLLPNFSKIFENVMCNRLIEFVEQYEILHCCQFGFRKNHSTSLVLIHLIHKISSAIDRHEITAGVFLDLSKAFDTLDHEILFAKLEHYGICDVARRWIKSSFSCRPQFVQFHVACSTTQTIKCGVPLGSILGPLFSYCTSMIFVTPLSYHSLCFLLMIPAYSILIQTQTGYNPYLMKSYVILMFG